MGAVKEVTIDIGGRKFVIASDDEYIHHFRKGFEPKMVKLFQSLLRPSDVVFDIGANIGCTALLFGGLTQQTYAFEPSPSTFGFLEQNVRKSGLANITMLKYGLGAEAAELTLTFSPHNRSGGFVSNHTQASAGHVVENIQIRTLDEVTSELQLPALDFLKIDVEGFEGHVLRGGAQALAKYKPTVVLELNHWCLNAFQRTSVPDFLDQLRATFPILLAVDGANYQDLHNPSESYTVMYNHILKMRFLNIIAGYSEDRLAKFRLTHSHQFVE